jgi:hypothetical protein
MGGADWPAKFTFDEFWNFTEPLEGGFAADCMFMVQDLQVATGMGITFTGKSNRGAGLQMAKALSWVYKPGHPQAGHGCSPGDIEADYDQVLSRDDIGRRGPGFLSEWKAMTNCRITQAGLKEGVRKRVVGNIQYVKTNRTGSKYLGDFDTFPADAQLCVISLTWANGNEFNYPKFAEACRSADWFEASRQCGFSSKENTLPKRQKAQEEMMRNAAAVKLGAASPETLHWPTILAAPDQTWLNGWWTVWDGNYYYYFFSPTGQVVYIETPPSSPAAPVSPHNRGTYTFDGAGRLVVTWNALPGLGACIETFYNARRGVTQMNANSNLYSPLVATKMS